MRRICFSSVWPKWRRNFLLLNRQKLNCSWVRLSYKLRLH